MSCNWARRSAGLKNQHKEENMKSVTQHILTGVMVLALAQAVALPAQAGIAEWFDNFYSKILGTTRDPDPTDKMVAPFAESEIKAKAVPHASPADLPVNQIGLEQPHRRSEDLAKWLATATAEVLSFSPDKEAEYAKLLPLRMTPAAQAEFKSWLTTSGIMAELQAAPLQLNGFVEEAPFLLNEGVVAGTYRWLYEVPVMISYLPRGVNTYEKEEKIKSRRLIVTVQVGRDPAATTEDAVLIETWAVRANSRKN
jgi:hypothetical protein